MKIYIYLDESGNIHKNSKTKYFAVGGYFTFYERKNKITSTYKRLNKNIKDLYKIPLDKEIKSFNMKDTEKIKIFKEIQSIDHFYGCAVIFNKNLMRKGIIESNIFFNYAVKTLFVDCILPIININTKFESTIEFVLSIDNRNIRVGDLKNLETYLKTEFCMCNYNFSVTYYDSANNYGVQLADLIVNTFYNKFKNINIVKEVIKNLNYDKFRISEFPGKKISGRIKKIEYNINVND